MFVGPSWLYSLHAQAGRAIGTTVLCRETPEAASCNFMTAVLSISSETISPFLKFNKVLHFFVFLRLVLCQITNPTCKTDSSNLGAGFYIVLVGGRLDETFDMVLIWFGWFLWVFNPLGRHSYFPISRSIPVVSPLSLRSLSAHQCDTFTKEIFL